jgi:hypothetical protein
MDVPRCVIRTTYLFYRRCNILATYLRQLYFHWSRRSGNTRVFIHTLFAHQDVEASQLFPNHRHWKTYDQYEQTETRGNGRGRSGLVIGDCS